VTDHPILDPAGLTGVNRRAFFRYTGTLSAAAGIAAMLAACGGPASTNAVNNTSAQGGGTTGGATSGSTCSSGAGTATGGGSGPSGDIECTLAFTLSSGFDPMNASSAVATCANQHMFEALIDLDPIDRKPYPALAKEQPSASDDGLTWTVSLRDGAKFSDGSDVTADDVVWSFTRCLDPANKALMGQFIPFIDKVTAKDKSTAEFTLKFPFSLFPQRIAVVKIVPKAKTGDAAASKTFDTAPIGSGPFQLVSADSTAGVKMKANPNYNGPRPAKVNTITMNTTPDNSARMNDLQGGRSQAIEAVPYASASALKGSQFTLDDKQAFNCLFLMFNCSAKPFDDKRVRQALFYGFDTDKVITTALQGYGTAATCYLDEGNAAYSKASTVYTYDPDKAKSLLADAGVKDLSFELVTTNTGFIADSAPVIIESWKSIGVTATLNTNPSSAVYGTLVPSDKFRVLAASGDPTVFGPDADLLLRWFYYGTTWPNDRYRWDEADAKKCASMIDEAAQAKDAAAQKQKWQEIFDFVADEVPLYPLFHTKTLTGFDPAKLDGFAGAATTGLYFLNVGRKG
jgi:peptide/nickel transport system substrate-binding protein